MRLLISPSYPLRRTAWPPQQRCHTNSTSTTRPGGRRERRLRQLLPEILAAIPRQILANYLATEGVSNTCRRDAPTRTSKAIVAQATPLGSGTAAAAGRGPCS